MGRALVLNASYQPLCVVPVRRALVLAIKGKADVIHTNGAMFRSESLEMHAPSVVRLNYFVKVPYRARASLSRRAVFVRDEFTCQYCGSPAENVDHVIPKSRGGGHTWDNVVAACRPCNSRKENRSPQDVGLRLKRPPTQPHESVWIVVAVDHVDPLWEQYLRLPKRRRPQPQLALTFAQSGASSTAVDSGHAAVGRAGRAFNGCPQIAHHRPS